MIRSGKAVEKFREAIRLQGGDERVIDDSSLLQGAAGKMEVLSSRAGFVTDTNCMEFGTALAMIGGGREKKEDSIDHGVGLEFHKRIGDSVEKGEPLATIHYNDDSKLAEAKRLVSGGYYLGAEAPRQKRPLIRRILGAQ